MKILCRTDGSVIVFIQDVAGESIITGIGRTAEQIGAVQICRTADGNGVACGNTSGTGTAVNRCIDSSAENDDGVIRYRPASIEIMSAVDRPAGTIRANRSAIDCYGVILND